MISDPWNMSENTFNDILDDLRFKYYKWDVYVNGSLKIIPESIVLSPTEHDSIVQASESLSSILRAAELEIKKDTSLLARLGIPKKVIPLLKEEPESNTQLARYDFFLTRSGKWQLSEFNDDVPGGFNDAIGIPELLKQAVPRYSNGALSFNRSFADSFLSALPATDPVALMYATAYAEDLQHMLVLKMLLEKRGQECLMCSPTHLRSKNDKALINGRSISSIVRFYPGEWFEKLDNIKDWQKQIAGLKMYNPLTRLISQSKMIFSILKDSSLLTESDRKSVAPFLPDTHFFDKKDQQQLQGEKDDWVLKEAFGRMGDNVCVGKLLSQQNWNKALKAATKKEWKFLIQKFFDVKPLRFACGDLYPAIGAYVINGRFAGYYSRASAKPFLTHEAYYVPTLVKTS